MPLKTKRGGGKIAIVNLQKTRIDSSADIVINAKCDEVMKVICDELSLTIPTVPHPPCEGLRMVKECFRPEPPKFRVKRVKVDKDSGDVVKTEEGCGDSASDILPSSTQNKTTDYIVKQE